MRKKRCDIVQEEREREEMTELLGTGEIYRDGLSASEALTVFRSIVQKVADEETTRQYMNENRNSRITIDGVLNLSTNDFWIMLEKSPELEANLKRAESRIILRKKGGDGYFECSRFDCINAMRQFQCSVKKQAYPNCEHFKPRYPEDDKRQAAKPSSQVYKYSITITPNGTR